MPNGDAALGLAGLQEWSEPIIFDRLLEAYVKRLGAGPPAWALARLHARAWRAAISDDSRGLEAVRRDLAEALRGHLLGGDDADDADAAIIAELLDIVMIRFQRSLSTARSYHLALIVLAGRLTAAVSANGGGLRAA
jgi:hypothetical protein